MCEASHLISAAHAHTSDRITVQQEMCSGTQMHDVVVTPSLTHVQCSRRLLQAQPQLRCLH